MQAGFFTKRAVRARSKAIWAGLLRISGLLSLAKAWVRRNGVIVLTFHRVLTEGELKETASLPGMVVKVETFDKFLEYASQRCEIVDLSKDPEWRRKSKLKIALTFDDGWSDNATSAYPIAQKHGAPMTIFIVPERTGQALPFWPELVAATLRRGMAGADPTHSPSYIEQVIEGLKELPGEERKRRVDRMMRAQAAPNSSASVDTTMTWEQIARLQAAGATVGSHTCTHEILTCVAASQAREEITASRGLIQRQLGADCSLFSYPNGNCSRPVRDLAATAGYKLAFLNQKPGVWTQHCDPYLAPRVNVCESHLVNARGSFSPLIFEYAVVWKAARGLFLERCADSLRRLRGKRRNA